MVLRLVPLPVSTLGEIAALGLEAHVFAGARFRCTRTLWDGSFCNAGGYLTIRPPTLLPTGQDVGLADIYCDRCVPPWRALQIDPKREPWRVRLGHVLVCPGCRQRLQVRERKRAYQPIYAPRPEF